MNQEFSNESMDARQLPDLQALEMEPISPRYRVINLVLTGVIFGGLAIVFSLLRFQSWASLPAPLVEAYGLAMAVTVSLGVVFFIYHLLADPLIKYALREQDLAMCSGLVFRKVVCQPILRVQHIELKRGPVERLAGLAKLQVFSAGGASHTFEIPGLPVTTAQKLRQYILAHKDLGAR